MSGLSLPATLGPLARVTADDQARYSMNGVQVTDPGDGTFCCVGTDGRYLLVVRGIQAGDRGHMGCPPDRSLLIPAAAWTEAFRKVPALLDQPRWSNKPKTVEVSLEGRKVRLSGHERSLTTDELDGRFPDWRQALPKKPPAFSIAVDPEKLADLLKTVQGMIGESHKVVLAFWKDNEPLAVVARNQETGLCLDGILMPLTPSPSEMAKEKAERAAKQEERREEEPWYECKKCQWHGSDSAIVAAHDACPGCKCEETKDDEESIFEEYEPTPEELAAYVGKTETPKVEETASAHD
jgi:hypothetical protein